MSSFTMFNQSTENVVKLQAAFSRNYMFCSDTDVKLPCFEPLRLSLFYIIEHESRDNAIIILRGGNSVHFFNYTEQTAQVTREVGSSACSCLSWFVAQKGDRDKLAGKTQIPAFCTQNIKLQFLKKSNLIGFFKTQTVFQCS